MSGARTVVLGGQEFEIRPFSLKQMQAIMPPLTQQRMETPAGMDAMATVVFKGVTTARPEMSFEEFQALQGVTVVDLRRATKVIGQMVGYFQEDADEKKEAPPGEAAAGEPA